MKPLFSIPASCRRQQGKACSNHDGDVAACLANSFPHGLVVLGYDSNKFIYAPMNRLPMSIALVSSLLIIPCNAAKAETIFYVGEGQDCPKYTKPRGDGYCKAIVDNKFTGAYLNGGCPPGSGPVGQGYCMYNY